MPTFAFIDPFGWTGAPFEIVKKFLANPSCEVFVNFMYEEINRFIGHKDQTENFNTFFGSTPGRHLSAYPTLGNAIVACMTST